MNVEKASWIAGIVGTAFAIIWGIITYLRPPESPPPPKADNRPLIGNKNVIIEGNNNVIGTTLDTPLTPSNNPEASLTKITTGMSRTFLEGLFGPARYDELNAELGANNLIFVFPRFFLQAVVSRDRNVIFYSVTTRSGNFRPSIPKLGGELLNSHFSDFGEAVHVYSNMTSKYYEYAERINIGNAGNYHNIYLGYCPAGAPPVWEKFTPMVLEDDGPVARNKFRAENTPNCFGVGEILGKEDEVINTFHMGIDYYVSRDLP